MAAENWGLDYKRFNLLLQPQEEVELRIPQKFWNMWGDQVDDIIEVWDPVGNDFHCRVNSDDEGGFFMDDLTTMLRHCYRVERTTIIYFRMLRSNLFLIHIETTSGEVYVYPRFSNENHQQLDDEGDRVLSEEIVNN